MPKSTNIKHFKIETIKRKKNYEIINLLHYCATNHNDSGKNYYTKTIFSLKIQSKIER